MNLERPMNGLISDEKNVWIKNYHFPWIHKITETIRQWISLIFQTWGRTWMKRYHLYGQKMTIDKDIMNSIIEKNQIQISNNLTFIRKVYFTELK